MNRVHDPNIAGDGGTFHVYSTDHNALVHTSTDLHAVPAALPGLPRGPVTTTHRAIARGLRTCQPPTAAGACTTPSPSSAAATRPSGWRPTPRSIPSGPTSGPSRFECRVSNKAADGIGGWAATGVPPPMTSAALLSRQTKCDRPLKIGGPRPRRRHRRRRSLDRHRPLRRARRRRPPVARLRVVLVGHHAIPAGHRPVGARRRRLDCTRRPPAGQRHRGGVSLPPRGRLPPVGVARPLLPRGGQRLPDRRRPLGQGHRPVPQPGRPADARRRRHGGPGQRRLGIGCGTPTAGPWPASRSAARGARRPRAAPSARCTLADDGQWFDGRDARGGQVRGVRAITRP